MQTNICKAKGDLWFSHISDLFQLRLYWALRSLEDRINIGKVNKFGIEGLP